ncbi:MAG TPA: flagellar motor stator protein MotA [Thermodesulfobacteriota bacterium]|jgi:chemotaxis protein MotA|nr:flagellar motor stator protein MotA [Thermodesulfobacteriota bacterium]
MFTAIGIIVVLVAVVGGYLFEHGNLSLLFQPAEFIIIFGAALGSFLIASPPKVVGIVIKNTISIVSLKSYTKENYIELLSLLYQIFTKIKKEGLVSIESDIEDPDKSPIFKKYGSVNGNRLAVNSICDNLKVIITTNVSPHELETLMDTEIEAFRHESMLPARSLSKVADALPGLGIVAAVLGVILTMGKIDQPPAVIGHSIGAALVGTFLGVLMSYGFVSPMATKFEHMADENRSYLEIIKIALVAFVSGAAPQIAVEFGRRAIPVKERPLFNELEKELRKR